jgi:hypothetical protein
VWAVFPCRPRPDRVDQKTHALIVRRVEPEHPVEHPSGLLEPAETPAAQPKAVHAAQERPVIEAAPGQHAVELVAQRQLADTKSHLIMTNGLGGPIVEDEVAEVRMRIQATKIGVAEFHQSVQGLAWVATRP